MVAIEQTSTYNGYTNNATNGQTPPRVVITGMGAITPLGLNVSDTWSGLIAGRSGIDHITHFDTSQLRTTFAGEVRGFDPKNYMDRKEVRRTDPYIQFAIAATEEALSDSGLNLENEDPTSVGIIIGSGVGGINATGEGEATMAKRGMRKLSPFAIPNMLVDSAGGKLAIIHNVHGPNHAVVSACASGTSACGEAFEMIRRGDAEVMIAGGAEAALVPIMVAGFDVMGAMSQRNDDPATSCRPFDSSRDGFVMGEGSVVLIMERLEHALARNARIYAEVIGYGSSADAFHMAAPHEHGRGAADAMRMALRKAKGYGVNIEDIDYINAHGTATRLNDVIETGAIKKVLGEHAYNVQISSTKSMTGHLLGGAGALETMVCAKVISENKIPPTINLENQDPECDLNYTPLVAQSADVKVTLSNSFGFGGHNASIMLREYA
ncbi:MAG: beta-ketoacyl-ACP synthase II [Chloroflexota bacterium]